MKSGKEIFLSFITFFLTVHTILAQPSVQFSLPEKACKDELFAPANTSDINLQYNWEFCYGGLLLAPAFQNSITNTMALAPDGLTVVEDNGSWYGFVVGTNSHNLVRLDFGNVLTNNPTMVNLGNPAGSLARPRDIALIKHNENWFAFIANYDQISGTAKVVRFDFGTSITSAPIATNLGDFSGRLTQPFSIKLKVDNGNLIALIGDRSQRKLLLVNFESSPTITPTSGTSFLEIFLPAAGFFGDFDILKFGSDWHGLTVSENGAIQKIKFINALFSTPQITIITDQFPIITSPSNIVFLRDIEKFVALVTEYSGNLILLNFGESPDSSIPVFENLGNGGLLANNQGIALLKQGAKWIGYTHNIVSGVLSRIVFQGDCNANLASSTLFEPSVSYSTGGVKLMSLEVTNSVGEKQYKIDSILIKRDPLPEFTFVYNCTDQQTSFSDGSVLDGEIVSWHWNFGDPSSGGNNISTSQNPEHMFNVADTYSVQLEITDDCANTTQITKPVFVNDTSLADLSIQSAAEVCSFQFVDLSPESSLGLSAVREPNWTFGDGESSLLLQPTHQYSSDGDYQIILSAVVNECKKTTEKMLLVKPGTDISFSSSGICEGNPTMFSLQSSGPQITDVLWSFGDGETSSKMNPDHIYGAGDFLADVEVTNLVNCVNTISQTVSIYSKPQPNFSLDLPPFSCAGSVSQFNDLTPPLTDSNLASWSWSFGDAANGTSVQKNPTYIYNIAAEYDVFLQVTSNFGCSSSIDKTITISPSPVAEFATGPACINKPTQFTDASGSEVKAWLWSVNNSSYTTKNPTHTFSTTGTQSVMLTVTANNNCVNQKTKTVVVPVPVVADFTSASTCAGTTTVFQEINSGGVDPAVAWNWSFAGQANASTSSAQHIFPNTGNFPVTLTSTRLSGCSYSLTKSILISQPPAASFTVSTEAGAAPLAVGFTNTSSLATSFLWKFNDPINSTSTDFSPAFVFNQLGSYQVELIASNAAGCSDNFTETIQVVVPEINAVLSDFILSSTPDGGKKATVTIENKSNITLVNPEVYIDLSGNAVIREKLSGTILPGQSITRMLTVDIIPRDLTYACAEVKVLGDSFQFDNRACLNLTSEPTYFQPYPNPAQSQLFLDWINENQESLQVVIYNSSGQIAMNRKYNLLPGLNQVLVDVNNLATGIYFVSYSDGRIIRSFRFSVAR